MYRIVHGSNYSETLHTGKSIFLAWKAFFLSESPAEYNYKQFRSLSIKDGYKCLIVKGVGHHKCDPEYKDRGLLCASHWLPARVLKKRKSGGAVMGCCKCLDEMKLTTA